jgi:leucyl aminopeptidase (aminopeptidase T)
MNPKTKPDGTSFMDEGSQDNTHIAIGTNEYFPGGKIKAKGHYDLVMSFCTLDLDGVVVIKDGKPVF